MAKDMLNLDWDIEALLFDSPSERVNELLRIMSPMSVRAFCHQRKQSVAAYRAIGAKTIDSIQEMLRKYGLRFGMTPRELGEYQGEYYARIKRQKGKYIDWEARTWQLACTLRQYYVDNDSRAVEEACTFIKLYKKQMFDFDDVEE